MSLKNQSIYDAEGGIKYTPPKEDNKKEDKKQKDN